jgi:acetyltransferase-like isoleucine patch superfamily enzyme
MKKFKIIWIITHIYRFLWWLLNFWRFKRLGLFSFINHPLRIDGAKNISIGDKVIVQYKTWLASMPLTDTKNPILEIGNGSAIGNFNHIYATKKIIIGRKVLTADKVYISDNLHSYENPFIPIIDQSIKQNREVFIGDGCWIGENVCIIGASIGKHCTIGANSVVTNDIPDFCVAVGSPAKIIKRYNSNSLSWEKTNPDGSFIII